MRRALALTVTAFMLALVAATTAQADPIADCGQDGKLNGHYTNGQLQNALHNLPTDLNEYTDCADVIRGALLSNTSGGNNGSSNGSGSSSGAAGKQGSSNRHHVKKKSPREQRKLLDHAATSGATVDVAGAAVTPGIGNGAANDLPGAVMAGFVGLGLVGLAGGALLAWRNPRIRRLFHRG